MKQVRDIMTTQVQSVTPQTDLITVARHMRDLNVGSLPIVENNRLLGIITDRDIVIRVIAEGRNPQTEQVLQHLTPNPMTIHSEASVNDAADLMAREQIRRLPVVDEGKLVGWLALGDVAVEVDKDKLSGDTLEQISQPSEPRSQARGQ